MNIDESHDNYSEMKLYNEVMGIGLAVWAHSGDSQVFRIIDKSLDSFSIEEMQGIKVAFNMLPDVMQQEIMADQKTENTIAAIEKFTRHVSQMIRNDRARSA